MSKKVLIVEDDMDISRNLADVLETAGYIVECATDGKAALEKLRNSKPLPSLILLDLMMPKMDGYEFRQEQEKDAALASVPVVIMTADGNIEAKKYKIGAKAFIRKPVDLYNVLEVVRRFSKEAND